MFILRTFALALLVAGGGSAGMLSQSLPRESSHQTPYYSVRLSLDEGRARSLSLDSLGQGKLSQDTILGHPGKNDETRNGNGQLSTDRPSACWGVQTASSTPSGWEVSYAPREIRLTSRYRGRGTERAFEFCFNTEVMHATLLGIAEQESVSLPAVLHLPRQGSFRITSTPADVSLNYTARRNGVNFVKVSFPPADTQHRSRTYRLLVVAIYPDLPQIRGDARFDGFRRNYLNALQMHAQFGVLANNAASDPCPFVLYQYAEIARFAPPLAPGLRALDLVRVSLDRYLKGFLGYGMPEYKIFDASTPPELGVRYIFSDVYPSLLISADVYTEGTSDVAWLNKAYPGLRAWTEEMLKQDSTGNGLIKYPASGNSNSWKMIGTQPALRPANWWDAIGFGYEDAYSNALAYRALQGMARMAHEIGREDDAIRYGTKAKKLKDAYGPAFLNPRTGVLAGWRSEDGQLHDYYFHWVNGVAVHYGLLPKEQAVGVLDKLTGKMDAVGFHNFQYGLPGNLVPVQRKDYVHLEHRWGGPEKEDGSDGFQIYENGAATASYVYFTLSAMYKNSRKAEADKILFPMLQSYDNGTFQGRAANGFTNDWRSWDGTANGYEGFLADNYVALAAVVQRSQANAGSSKAR